jgi:hypothetical protein
MIVTLDAKRRVTIPAGLASASPGDQFDVVFVPEEDSFILRRITRDTDWLSVLKSCPVSMDDLPPRSDEVFQSKL